MLLSNSPKKLQAMFLGKKRTEKIEPIDLTIDTRFLHIIWFCAEHRNFSNSNLVIYCWIFLILYPFPIKFNK